MKKIVKNYTMLQFSKNLIKLLINFFSIIKYFHKQKSFGKNLEHSFSK